MAPTQSKDEIDLETIREGVKMRRLCVLDDLSVDYVEVEPGSVEFRIVHHECDEAWYVLDGVLQAFVGDRQLSVRSGDCVKVPRGTPHGSENRSGEVVKMLVVNGPPWSPAHDHAVSELG
ncbi:MAG TPA: cupin domain-containing protein [Solirubrobacterales bacterium]|nr:cupin domain-containing protein [Solirubrobacterales bacterium]